MALFVIAVREEVLEKQPEIIKTILEIINKTTANFKEIANIDTILAEKIPPKERLIFRMAFFN
jgi:ABC-type nitrate/sulfonate/bicarbonate transport system substrate-binding protein